MATITANGVRLAYDQAGVGSSVVWVHGGFTDRRGADLITHPDEFAGVVLAFLDDVTSIRPLAGTGART